MAEPIDNTVLRTMIGHPKFAEFSATVIEETYDVMLRLAPRLAAIAPIANHWVRHILHHGFVSVDDVKKLCDAECAFDDATNIEHTKGVAHEAFVAGAQWAMSDPDRTSPMAVAFEQWWQTDQEEGDRG